MKRKFWITAILIVFTILSNITHAQESAIEMVFVKADKTAPSDSATLIEINPETIMRSNTLAEILRDIPGIEVVQQGGIGQTTSVFIRGAKSEGTLVLIDGTEANDAMSPGGGFDFSSMTADNIERIEIYRGPQSVRFGAGALGGVINIITKEGRSTPAYTYLGEMGSYFTHREAISASGKVDTIGYSLSGGYFATKGFSAASEHSGNREDDGAKISTGSMKLSWTPRPTTKIETSLRYAESTVDIDYQGGTKGDDPNNSTHSKQLLTGVTATEHFFAERLKTSLSFYFSETTRRDRNEPDTTHPTQSSYYFLSENRKIQSETEWFLNELHSLRLILNYRDENGISDSLSRKSQSMTGESLTYLFESSTWFFDLGARIDQSSQIGAIASQKVSLGRFLSGPRSKVLISYGSGYKLPSLFQLYSIYGDINLQQENSTALEAMWEQNIYTNADVQLTMFDSKFHNLIDYDMATSHYLNISQARSQGFEFQVAWQPMPSLKLSGTYTYLESKDESTGLPLLRRPRDTWFTSISWSATRYEVYAQYSYRGQREDVDPSSFQRVQMDPFSLTALGGAYQFEKWLKAHARIENLFDTRYE
ncbi:MAG: TonB-dependent receptor plug domain-containing protein, partial [Bdellovibrio sp.]